MQAGKKQHLYNGAFDCAAKIYKKEGLGGFFKGSFSNMVRSVGSSLVLVLYDEIQKALKKAKKVEAAPVVKVAPVVAKKVETPNKN